MRYRLPVALLAGALVGLSVGLVAVGRSVGSRRAMEWVERALGPSRPALSGEAVVGTRASGTWVERTAEVTEYGAVTRLEWLDDPRGRISLDDGTRLWELDPSTRTALLRGVSPAGADTGRLAANYRAEFAGWRDVAGYPTQGIRPVTALRGRGRPTVGGARAPAPCSGRRRSASTAASTRGPSSRASTRTVRLLPESPGWRPPVACGQVAQPLAPGDLPGRGPSLLGSRPVCPKATGASGRTSCAAAAGPWSSCAIMTACALCPCSSAGRAAEGMGRGAAKVEEHGAAAEVPRGEAAVEPCGASGLGRPSRSAGAPPSASAETISR